MPTIPLKSLPGVLAKRTGLTPPRYHRCYLAILDGLLPAKKVDGQWHIADVDLPIAEHVLGLVPADPTTTP